MFGSLLTAMITPFNKKKMIDYEKAADIANYLVENGSDGLVVSGTTGESPTISDDEKYELFRVVKEAVGTKAKVIAGTGCYSTEKTLKRSIKASKMNIDGVMLVTPYYNKPSQKGLIEHFKMIAIAVPDTPVMLYNVPSRTGVNLGAESFKELKDASNIVALKEASGNYNQISNILEITNEDFCVYSGNDNEILPVMSLGGTGVVSVASHIVGNEIKKMLELFKEGSISEAAMLHRKLLPVFEAMFINTSPMPVKYAMNVKGFDVGGHRLPLGELEESEKQVINNILADLRLL